MNMDERQDHLDLDSRLTELSRVQRWADDLADRYGLAEEARFAIHLCLEEALANVVLHGYGSEPGHPISIRSWVSEGALNFAIDDKAMPFAPVDPRPQTASARPARLESIEPGGNGIRLLYRFAGSVDYERRSDGNRLRISFPLPTQHVSADRQRSEVQQNPQMD